MGSSFNLMKFVFLLLDVIECEQSGAVSTTPTSVSFSRQPDIVIVIDFTTKQVNSTTVGIAPGDTLYTDVIIVCICLVKGVAITGPAVGIITIIIRWGQWRML